MTQPPLRPRHWPSYPAMLVALEAQLHALPRDAVQLYARSCWDAGYELEVAPWRSDLKAELAKSEASIHTGLLIYAIRTYAKETDRPELVEVCERAIGGDRKAIEEIRVADAHGCRQQGGYSDRQVYGVDSEGWARTDEGGCVWPHGRGARALQVELPEVAS